MRVITTIIAGALTATVFGAGAASAQDEVLPAASGYTISGPWRTGPELAQARSGLSAAVLDGRIYAAGGSGLVDPRAEVEVYDPEARIWRLGEPLPVGLERFGMTAAGGRIWVAGGYAAGGGSAPSDQVWSFDPNAGAWQSEPALPGPKASFALLSHDDRLYALGGEDGAAGMFVFDPEGQSWSALPAPAETARRGAAAVAHDGEFWLIGGASEGAASARVDVYDPEAGAWRRGPDLPAPRAGHAAAVIDGAIHIFGGRSADLRRTLADHLALVDGAWTDKPAMVNPRTEAAAAALEGEIWLIGGGAGAGFFAPFTAVNSVDVVRPAAE
ncbi:MAG: kelch repeat-containing protein [Oceanicaulis sp.]